MAEKFVPNRGSASGANDGFDAFTRSVEKRGDRVVSSGDYDTKSFVARTCSEGSLKNCKICIYRAECEDPVTS